MTKYLLTATAALLLSSAGWAQTAATHTSSHKVITTSNGKVTSATTTTKTKSCRNDKGQFIACSSATKTSVAAMVSKDAAGKCRFTSGPKKGQFTKCP